MRRPFGGSFRSSNPDAGRHRRHPHLPRRWPHGHAEAQAATLWIQNVMNAPVLAVDSRVRAFMQELNVSEEELISEADRLGLNLSVLEDLLAGRSDPTGSHHRPAQNKSTGTMQRPKRPGHGSRSWPSEHITCPGLSSLPATYRAISHGILEFCGRIIATNGAFPGEAGLTSRWRRRPTDAIESHLGHGARSVVPSHPLPAFLG
jgi:hypothetical protein